MLNSPIFQTANSIESEGYIKARILFWWLAASYNSIRNSQLRQKRWMWSLSNSQNSLCLINIFQQIFICSVRINAERGTSVESLSVWIGYTSAVRYVHVQLYINMVLEYGVFCFVKNKLIELYNYHFCTIRNALLRTYPTKRDCSFVLWSWSVLFWQKIRMVKRT